MRQASSRLRRAARRRPAWWIFSRLALIAASNGRRLFAGGQQVVEVLEREPSLAGRGRVEGLPDRLDASRPHQLGDVGAFDPPRVAGINGQLFHLGRQEPRLRPDQLDQETSTVGGELDVETSPCELRQPRDELRLARGGRVDRQPGLFDELGQLRGRRPLLHLEQAECPSRRD